MSAYKRLHMGFYLLPTPTFMTLDDFRGHLNYSKAIFSQIVLFY